MRENDARTPPTSHGIEELRMKIIRGRSFWNALRSRITRTTFGWLLALSAFGLVSHADGTAQAQSTARSKAPSADYQQLIERGLAAYNQQRPAEARAWFAKAHALQPGARTQRALGIADLALDNYSMAKDELEAALAQRVTPLTEEQRSEVKELLGWMRANLATLHLRCSPLHAEAKIDGRPVAQPEVLLAPEEHRLTVSARGFVPTERTFTITMDRPLRLEIALDRAAESPGAPITSVVNDAKPHPALAQATTPPEQATHNDGPKLWPWLGGAGAVLLVAGGTMFAFGVSDKAKVEHATQPVRLSELQAAHDRVPWLTGVGLSLGIAGIAGMGAAAVLLLTQRESHEDVAWSLEAGLAHMSITRRF
jgi:hypothetical protein